MPEITVAVPNIGQEAVFKFKEPFATYIKNKFNLSPQSTKFRVISIIALKDTIRNDLRDPFTDLYVPASIDEVSYKKDLLDDVPVISFAYVDKSNVERYFRVPLNYIESISSVTSVVYANKLILIDLNHLPADVDNTAIFNELKTFIETRLGVVPDIKEVSVGDLLSVSSEEHETRETIRNNTKTVYKTQETLYRELEIKYNCMISRLTEMGISLG